MSLLLLLAHVAKREQQAEVVWVHRCSGVTGPVGGADHCGRLRLVGGAHHLADVQPAAGRVR